MNNFLDEKVLAGNKKFIKTYLKNRIHLLMKQNDSKTFLEWVQYFSDFSVFLNETHLNTIMENLKIDAKNYQQIIMELKEETLDLRESYTEPVIPNPSILESRKENQFPKILIKYKLRTLQKEANFSNLEQFYHYYSDYHIFLKDSGLKLIFQNLGITETQYLNILKELSSDQSILQPKKKKTRLFKFLLLLLFPLLIVLEINSKLELQSEIKNTERLISKMENREKMNEHIEDLKQKIEETKKDFDNSFTLLQQTIRKKEIEYNQKNQKLLELEQELKNYQQQYDQLLKQNTVKLSNIVTLNQHPTYPTGCEGVALSILLRMNGRMISIQDIMEKLPKGDKPYMEDGVKYGGNPELEFIGDPTDSKSYGVYEGPILEIANYFKKGAVSLTNSSLDIILEKVKQGHPVQVWVTLNLKDPFLSNNWIYKETGEKIYWKSGFHSLVVVGYNPEQIYVSDPDTGTVRAFDRNQFEKVYNYMGKRAIYYE